jgi:hypothetical protein
MTRVALRSVMVTVGVVLVCGARSSAQTPPPAPPQAEGLPAYRARLMGVYDAISGDPVEGVRVLDLLSGLSAVTTTTGTVSLLYLPDGGGLVRLQKVGYQPVTMRVAIGPTETTPLTVVIERVTQLPGIVSTSTSPSKYLSPALRGFEERMRSRVSGVFIVDSIIRRDESRRLADLIRTHANITIQEGQAGKSWLMMSPRCSNGGPPQVYLDGVPLAAPDDPSAPKQKASDTFVFKPGLPTASTDQPLQPFDLSQFNLNELAGIEYYPDNAVMPTEFTHTAQRCGALLLWARER